MTFVFYSSNITYVPDINNKYDKEDGVMNNKNRKVAYCDLGAITKKLDDLEIENKGEIQDIRIKLATIWLNHALKMQRFKDVSSEKYRYYATGEDFILSAMEGFWKARRYVQKAFSNENAKGFGRYVNTTQTRMRK